MKITRHIFALIFLFILLPHSVLAKQAIPDSLQAWVPWVLSGNEHLQCPFINQSDFLNPKNHVCAWAGELTINANESGASFEQKWHVLSPTFIPLPGDKLSWPQSVLLNQKVIAVIEHQGQPVIEVEAGEYKIQGQFLWSQIPSNIHLPPQTALINLNINQQKINYPKIEADELWLQQNQIIQTQHDEVELSVARKISDEAYLKLDTFISLSVAGKMREVALGKVLPEGFSLIGIQSQLPAFLDADGILYVKLKPGDWDINITASALPTLLTWQRPEVSHLWPSDEVWVMANDEKLRSGKVNGGTSIDSSQATMPESWYALPSYLLKPNDSLSYEINHRGMPLQLENRLRLERQLWLAFDQKNLNFVDQISGTMNKDWRISMTPPFILESAEDADGAVLITSIKDDERGLETRYSGVKIETRGSIASSTTLPVSGYDHDFDKVFTTVHLPPGHDLFAVFGADSVSSSWWSNWSIWSSFIVLLATIATTRLIGIMAGTITAFTLLFVYQQSGAPVVIMLNLLVAFAVRKHLNFAALKTLVAVYWGLSVTLALGAVLFFAVSQLRTVIYPQLEGNYAQNAVETFNQQMMNEDRFMAGPSEEDMVEDTEYYSSQSLVKNRTVDMITVTGAKVREKDLFIERYQTDALMQAGSGIPTWHWKSYTLNWQSPVAKGQQFELWILNKTTNRIFKSVGIVLTLLWLYILLSTTVKSLIGHIPTRTVLAILAAVLLTPSYTPDLHAADFPDQSLLKELSNRMLKAPDCAPQCATISRLNVTAANNKLELTFTLHAVSATAVALPRSEFWRAEKIQLNEKALPGLFKVDNWIYVPIEKGVSELSVIGQLIGADELQLEFKELPKYVEVSPNEDWQVIGLQGNQLSGNALTFLNTQIQPEEESQARSRYNQQPLVKVFREISFDQNWRITTLVERIAPAQGSISLSIPTLPGEAIISSAISVKDNSVQVTIPAGEQSMQWRSTLQRSASLTMQASDELPIIEHWSLTVSPAWHATMQGVPLVLEQQSADDYYAFHFYPYPGESLQVELERPTAAAGQVIAFDRVELNIEQGSRTSTVQLDMQYRSTRGGEHQITLPADFQLNEVMIDNKVINLTRSANALSIPIYPGLHNIRIAMRANAETTSYMHSPVFELNAPVSNITTNINVDRQRWVLWTSGPTLGPAVLYWGELFTFILVALMLSRLTFSPLSAVSWIILGLGLSLNNWTILMMMVVWFAAITASQYRSSKMSVGNYNLIQVGLYTWSIITVISLIAIVPMSLLGSPSMGIEGNYSSDYMLRWFADQSQGMLPDIAVFSVPLWIYKGLMFVWVIWLSFALINWIKWAWQKLGEQGYWKKASVIQTKNK